MRLSLAVSLLLLGGCTVYVPLDPGTPPSAGTNVRARLTTPGALRVSDRVGSPVQEVEGEVLVSQGDSLGLRLMATTEYGRPWDAAEVLTLSTLEIYQLEEKRLDRKRTAFLAGGVGVVSGVIVAALFNASGSSKDNDPGGDIDAILIPFLTIRH